MNQMPGFLWLKADDVAREGYEAVMNGTPVVVNGFVYRTLAGDGEKHLELGEFHGECD